MCGIAAVLLADSSGDVNTMLFDALTVLQHRGQDAAGMVTCELSPPHRLHLRKDNGLVKDVFTQQHMLELVGPMGLAHARYPTAGSSSCAEAQPLYTNYPCGVCIAHRQPDQHGRARGGAHAQHAPREHRLGLGDARQHLRARARRPSSAAAATPPRAARSTPRPPTSSPTTCSPRARRDGQVPRRVLRRVLVNKLGLVAFRDPHGIRPVVYGRRRRATRDAAARR